MKKLFISLLLLATAALLAEPLILSTDTKPGGVTTTVTIGRVQGDPAADGSLTLTVIGHEVVTLSDGTVISDQFAPTSRWLQVKLSDDLLARLNAEIAAAKEAAEVPVKP